jgi:hypothetical protein
VDPLVFSVKKIVKQSDLKTYQKLIKRFKCAELVVYFIIAMKRFNLN